MDDLLARNWWAVALRGCLAIGFGLIAWLRPSLTLTVLTILFGVYALDDGIFAIVSAVRAARRHQRWWTMALEGVFSVSIGLLVFLLPMAAQAVVFLVIAVWAVCTGALEVAASLRVRKTFSGSWLLTVAGLLRLAYATLLLWWPQAGLRALVGITACYAIAHGVVLWAFALHLRRHVRGEHPGSFTAQPA
jgi:uncharacterized membrane protein HdeD (DUF308 family)